MMSHTHPGWNWILLPLTGLILLTGCDASFQPIDDDAGLFSVYGYLTLSGGPHFLRVKDLDTPLTPDSTRVLDATVTLKNLSTGRTETLTDSIVLFEGIYTHNFRADQDVQPATRYRITITQGDGKTRATATMPEETEVDIEPNGAVGCVQNVFVNFQNVSRKRLLQMSVGIPWRGPLNWVRVSDFYSGDDGALIGQFNPASIVRRVVSERVLGTVGFQPEKFCSLLDRNRIYVAYTRFGPDWPADSVRADPTRSAVKNGLGTFGGLDRDTLVKSITPSP